MATDIYTYTFRETDLYNCHTSQQKEDLIQHIPTIYTALLTRDNRILEATIDRLFCIRSARFQEENAKYLYSLITEQFKAGIHSPYIKALIYAVDYAKPSVLNIQLLLRQWVETHSLMIQLTHNNA